MEEKEIVQEEEVLEEDTTDEEVETDETESEEKDEQPEEEIDWKARALKAEKTLIKSKKKPKTKREITQPGSQKSDDEIPEWGQKILATEEKRTFGYEQKLSPETVDAVFQFTGGKTPTEADMEHPAVKAIVKSLEAQVRVANNTPSGGGAPTYKGKTYAETVTAADATSEDKQNAFAATQKKHGIT